MYIIHHDSYIYEVFKSFMLSIKDIHVFLIFYYTIDDQQHNRHYHHYHYCHGTYMKQYWTLWSLL